MASIVPSAAAVARLVTALGHREPGLVAKIRGLSKATVDPVAQATLIDAFVLGRVTPEAKAVLATAPEQGWLLDGNGVSPFITACAYGVTAAVEQLVAVGANPNSTDPDGQTALSWAACFDCEAVRDGPVTHQDCAECGVEGCILKDQMDGKAQVVALLASSCSPATVQQAMSTARESHSVFLSDLAYHVDDHVQASREMREMDQEFDSSSEVDDDAGEIDHMNYQGDWDVSRYQDLVATAEQMIRDLKPMERPASCPPVDVP